MSKQKNITRISNLPNIVLHEEEGLRFFSMVVKSSKKTAPLISGESIEFIVDVSTRRNRKKKQTTWKLSLKTNMSVILLDSEIREDIKGNEFVDHLMKLIAGKVILSINREKERQRKEEINQKKKLRQWRNKPKRDQRKTK